MELNLESVYVGLLAALAFYSALAADVGITSFLAFYAFSYIALSSLALMAIAFTSFVRWIYTKSLLGAFFSVFGWGGLGLLSAIIAAFLFYGFENDLKSEPIEMGVAFLLSIYFTVSSAKPAQQSTKSSGSPIIEKLERFSQRLTFAGGKGFLLSLLILGMLLFFNSNQKQIVPMMAFAGLFVFAPLISLMLEGWVKNKGLSKYHLLISAAAGVGIGIALGIFRLAIYSPFMGLAGYQKISIILGAAYLIYFLGLVSKIPWKYFEEKPAALKPS